VTRIFFSKQQELIAKINPQKPLAQKKQYKPLPLHSLTSLQTSKNKSWALSAEKALQIAYSTLSYQLTNKQE